VDVGDDGFEQAGQRPMKPGADDGVVEVTNAQEWELHFREVSECDLIVDAIVGTGFHGPLTGLLETVVADVNGLGVPVVAIDLPTGVSADSHEVDGEAIEAT